MNKIPTAEEFCKNLQSEYGETGEYKMYFAIDIPNKLREFAKLHVKAALEAANEKAKINVIPIDEEQWDIVPEIITAENIEDNEGIMLEIDENSILKAYPVSNIK
jgi:hypothetical protein